MRKWAHIQKRIWVTWWKIRENYLDFVAQSYPDSDTEDFINTYMKSKTRKNIDDAMAYVNTMDAKELWKYFSDTENIS